MTDPPPPNPTTTTPITDPDSFLPPTIAFPTQNLAFRRLPSPPLTSYRRDAPAKAGCCISAARSNLTAEEEGGELFVMKLKIPPPSSSSSPSPATAAEIHALGVFREQRVRGVPWLVAGRCLWVGGVVVWCVVMTRVAGVDLMRGGFWGMGEGVKEEVREGFLGVLREVWRVGFAPSDRALRNVLWDAETRRVGIVDFEHYEVVAPGAVVNLDPVGELRAWGLASRPAASHWAVERGLVREYHRR
ncbi:hypothetical protein Tdes44962_MAKER05304 [Teratosphaeria destructans]|uniref:Uncharacterized protein n=1 Tax=Teratosphaeria destructans TaxID=418781 RepID=A0A9W7VZ70_9PEZI|nr:hypothetical protein Tdes44962_MAKER05304 [Teratosphaeria destructans]